MGYKNKKITLGEFVKENEVTAWLKRLGYDPSPSEISKILKTSIKTQDSLICMTVEIKGMKYHPA